MLEIFPRTPNTYTKPKQQKLGGKNNKKKSLKLQYKLTKHKLKLIDRERERGSE